MIIVIGIGPGDELKMTEEAKHALESSEVIVGYKTYIELVKPLIEGKEVLMNGMKKEIERCKKAIELSRTGKRVAVVSSGDPGVYGMAGLILELASEEDEIHIIPGLTASNSSAAVIGAPLMHDYCHISLSDLLTPRELIFKRVEYALKADFVICLYNPRSNGRKEILNEVMGLVNDHKGSDTVLGYVKNTARDGECSWVGTLNEFDYTDVDMRTMVIIGNSNSYLKNGKFVTPRGYTV